MRVSADRDVCIGSGNCVLTAPAVFDQDDEEGLVVVLTSDVEGPVADVVRAAVARCPSGALRLIEGQEPPAGP
ncbi:MAG: ferredoxin [Blastococcus sp.]|jgi:ferredoxin|nr:ferredoxin [Blastococcus sp.]